MDRKEKAVKEILIVTSRDLCYESNVYFVRQMERELKKQGYVPVCCFLTEHSDLDQVLTPLMEREYRAVIDFNSLLPRLELEDGTPFPDHLNGPFYNYLLDHPLYHHPGLARKLKNCHVLCIDKAHRAYVEKYYPNIRDVAYLPLGGMQALRPRSFAEKRFELLFLGTYVEEAKLWEEILALPAETGRQTRAMIDEMRTHPELTQEEALARYLKENGREVLEGEFARLMNHNYLADKYLRNENRRKVVSRAAQSGMEFTVVGHGWDKVLPDGKKQITVRNGVGFAASLELIADAKRLLNVTPGFHGGFHDRVYSAMANKTAALTEDCRFARGNARDGKDICLYNPVHLEELPDFLDALYLDGQKTQEIAENGYDTYLSKHTWEKRIRDFLAPFPVSLDFHPERQL